MHMLVMKNIANNIMYIVQELHIFYNHLMGLYSIELHPMELHSKSHYKAFHFHQYFCYTLKVIYQLFYFYICSF